MAFRHRATLFFALPLRPAAGASDGASKQKHVGRVFLALTDSRREGEGV